MTQPKPPAGRGHNQIIRRLLQQASREIAPLAGDLARWTGRLQREVRRLARHEGLSPDDPLVISRARDRLARLGRPFPESVARYRAQHATAARRTRGG